MAKESAPAVKPPAKKPDRQLVSDRTEGPHDKAAESTAEPGNHSEAVATDTDHSEAAAGGETEMFDGRKRAAAPQDATQALNAEQMDEEAKAAGKPAPGAAGKASVIGDYKLLKKLGQGGMGAVYKAHQISLDRDVALKVLSKELSGKPAFVQRFQREAKIMAKLDHPNILRCFEVKEAAGFHYLSMEFVEGGSLENWLKKIGKFEVGDALHTAITIGRALEHAHELGMIHRDIKPDNVLLTKKGVIKVADLGLAKATDDDMGLTKTGTGAGTPIYMAPEQARDVKHVDARCDIYALGVMLYVFLTGQAPFQGTTLVELIEAKEKGKFKPIRSFNAEVPERLDLIVGKMLAKDPKHRYASCTEVVEELEALGLSNVQLSFFAPAGAAPAPAAKSAPSNAPIAAKSNRPAPPSSAAAPAPVAPKHDAAKPSVHEEEYDEEVWYLNYKDAKGKQISKKVMVSQIRAMIKNDIIDSKAQLSKSAQSGYRAIGTYGEFETYFRGKIAEKKAGRGADKYKAMIEQIEQEEAARHRWKGLKAMFGSVKSFVGLMSILAVIAVAIIGGYYVIVNFMK